MTSDKITRIKCAIFILTALFAAEIPFALAQHNSVESGIAQPHGAAKQITA